MSFRNRTGLCGLLIGSSLAIASACGGLNDVKIVITDDAGGSGGHPGGGNGAGGKAGGMPGGGENPGEGGAGGVLEMAGAAGEGGLGGAAGETGIPDPVPGAPRVISVSPQDQATDGDVLGVVNITFSEALDPTSVTSDTVQIKDGSGAVVQGTLSYTDSAVTFKARNHLNLLGNYSVNVSSTVTDVAKNPMTRPFMSTFTVRDGGGGESESPVKTNTTGLDRLSSLTLASDGVGRAVAVWGQVTGSGSTNDVYASLFYQGKGWATPVKVNTNTLACSYPTVSMNASGNLIVGWIEYDSTQSQPYSIQTRRNVGGTWDAASTRADLPSSNTYVLNIQTVAVAMSVNGQSHAIWSAYDYNTSTTPAFNDYGVFARHADAAGTWDAPVISLSYLQQSSASVSAPAMAFDGDGNGFAAYQFASAAAPIKSSTLVFRYVATTNKWGTSAVASTTSDYNPMPVAVATNAAGEAILGWVHATAVDATTTTFDFMGSHYNKAWTPPAVISNTTTQLAYDSTTKKMASATWTGTSFLVAWSQSGGSPYNVYTNEYKAAWSSASIISDGNHSSLFPWLTSDGRGNALAVWYQTSDTAPTTTVYPADVEFSRFVGATDKWSNPARVSSAVAGYADARVVTLGDGTAVSTFQSLVRSGKVNVVNGLFENEFQ